MYFVLYLGTSYSDTTLAHPRLVHPLIYLSFHGPPVNHRHSFPLDPYDRQPLSGLLVCDIASSFHALSVLPSFIVTRSSLEILRLFEIPALHFPISHPASPTRILPVCPSTSQAWQKSCLYNTISYHHPVESFFSRSLLCLETAVHSLHQEPKNETCLKPPPSFGHTPCLSRDDCILQYYITPRLIVKDKEDSSVTTNTLRFEVPCRALGLTHVLTCPVYRRQDKPWTP